MDEVVRVTHVVAGLDAAHGGPSYSIPRLCRALSAIGTRTSLLAVAGIDDPRPDGDAGLYADCRCRWDFARTPILRHLRCSAGLARALREAAPASDVVHNHGLWLMPNVQSARAAARVGTPLVVSPRGMLAPAALRFSRLKKRAFWQILQGPAIRGAACLHATSDAEYREIRGFGLGHPVAVVPNGIDLPEPPVTGSIRAGHERVVLSLGRLHPKKGLDRLLQAWGQVQSAHPDWRLRILGPAESGYDRDLRAGAAALGLSRISIEGPLYGEAKQAAYAAAELFVLPTLNENFGLTVAEALAAGTPVIATKGAPWRGLDDEGCGWWVDQSAAALAAGMIRAMAMPSETLRAMGLKGRAWMAREFSWDRAAHQMLDVYRWLARTGDRPSNVRVD